MAWPAENKLGNKGVSLNAGHLGKLRRLTTTKPKPLAYISSLRKRGKGEGKLRGKVPFCLFLFSFFKSV